MRVVSSNKVSAPPTWISKRGNPLALRRLTLAISP
jgi:hypothetical protein